uniref:Uncharacterized protein n=1 Tax=Manihot esculenta TaxID=3983 RepID=A0A2C9VA94_MANES
MDFHSLARKELQALCKKNKIPANMTNVAMADALKALEKVEGLDELNSEPRSDPQESPARTTNVEPRTACRTSTRRKPINVEPESSQSMTRNRRATRRTVAEETGQENKNVNLLETPAMPTTRRRVQAASATRKMDAQLTEIGDNEEQAGQENSDVPVTPAMRTSRRKVPAVSTRRKTEAQKDEKSVQRVYGTRQSVRLLEKSIEDLSLKEKKRVEAVKIEGLCEETEQKNDVPGLDEDDEENSDSSDESSFQQVETSGDVVDMNCEAMEEKGSDIVITDNSETLNAALKPEIEKELNGSQDSLIVEMSDDDSVIVMETIVNFPDEASSEVMDSLTLEVSGSEGKSYEKNSMEDEQHGSHLHLDAAIEEECEDDAIEELPEGNGSDEVQENVNADKIQHKLLEKSDSIKEEPESPRFILQHESYEMNSVEDERYGSDDLHLDAAIGEECDDNAIKELPEGNGSDEVQENVNADKIQHKLLEKSDSIKEEPESPRFILQHESYEMNSVEDERHGNDDAAIGEECDDNAIKELPEGNESDEVQENGNADKIQDKLLEKCEELPDSIKEELESPRFILQHEKCEKASDDLANEYNNVGVNVMEAKESDMIIHDQKSSFCCPLVSDSEVAIEIPLGDDHVVPVEAAYACIQTLNKSPTSLKQMSPYQTVVSGDQVTGGTVSTVISSPFAANTIQGQFPRPNESTARKSSTKKQATIQKIINADINKENVENSGRKVEPKKDKIKKKEAEEEKQYEDISLRQLTKMVKEKLQIANKNNDGRNISKVGTRPALQVLTENCKAAGEPENKN